MKTNATILGIALLAGILASSPATAQENPAGQEQGDPMDRKDRAAMMQKIEAEIGLSPEQKIKMEALRAEDKGGKKESFEILRAKKEALRAILDGATLDEAQARSLASEINVLEGKMMQERIDHIINVRQILTPEQFKKLKELRKKHREERKGKKEGRGQLR